MSEANPAWQPFDPSDLPTPDIAFLAADGLVAVVCSHTAQTEGWGPELVRSATSHVAGSGRAATLYDFSLVRPSFSGLSDGEPLEGVTDVVRYGASLDRVTLGVGPFRFVPAGTVDADPSEVLEDEELLAGIKASREAAGGLALLCAPADASGIEELVARVGTAIWVGREDETVPGWLADGTAEVVACVGPPSRVGSTGSEESPDAPASLEPPLPKAAAFATRGFEADVDDVVDDVPLASVPSDDGDVARIEIETGPTHAFEEVEIDLDEGAVEFVEPESSAKSAVEEGATDAVDAGGRQVEVEGTSGEEIEADPERPGSDEPPLDVPQAETVVTQGEEEPDVGGLEIEPEWPDFTKPLVVAEPGEIDPLDAAERERPSSPASFDFGVDVEASAVLDEPLQSGSPFAEGGTDDLEPHLDLDDELGAAPSDPWEGTGTFEPESASSPTPEPEVSRPPEPPVNAASDDEPPVGSLPWEEHAPDDRPKATAPVADVTRTVKHPRRPRGFLYVLFALFLLTIVVLAWAGYIEIPGIDWFQGDTP